MADKKLKVGIIGCGGIANGKDMPNLKKLKELEMVAFCDIVEERAVEAAAKYGTEDAKTYLDYKELLADPAIDVVHVCTPNRSHSFITVDALEAGKHVMCEKPMAKTYADAKLMLEAAQRTGKKLTIGYQQRWRGDSLYLKEMCDAGELGEIYYAEAIALRRRAVPTWGVFLNEYEQGGGPLIDIGTHALDLTLWVMNNYKPRMVVGTSYRKLAEQTPGTGNAWGDWDPDEFTTEDSAFGFIVMENGATIILKSSWALNIANPDEAVCLLAGTKAGADMKDGLRINFDEFGKLVTKKPALGAEGVAFFAGTETPPEHIEARTFYDAVLYGKPLTVLPEQALVVTQILEAIYESAKSGKPVTFKKGR